MANKVQFNLKNVHYAVLTETVGGGGDTVYAWASPVHVPGAVSINLEAQGDITPFYADGITYYKAVASNGYEGDLEIAKIPDAMLKDIWGFTLGGTSKVLTENATVEPKSFALLFQIDGDVDNERYVLYNCSATRPGIASTTNTDTKEPQTETCSISCAPLANGVVRARTTYETPSERKNGWFDSVFVEGGSAYMVEYDANGGTGRVVDGNNPYESGDTVTVLAATGLTGPDGKTFSKWNTEADGTGTDRSPLATFTITQNTKLYAVWA